jgi:hypothetical protein
VLVPGVVIPKGSWRAVVLLLEQPRRIPPTGFQFDVLQRVGDRIVGGSTYRIESRSHRRRPRVPRGLAIKG